MILVVLTPEERRHIRSFTESYYSKEFDFDRRFDPDQQEKIETRYRGSLGEWAAWKQAGKTLGDYTGYKFKNRLNKTDIVLKEKRWDIKTKRTIPPQPHFNSSVEKFQHEHAPGEIDGYLFCNVNHTLDVVYIVGFMELSEFDQKKVSREAGPDPEDSAGTSKVYNRPIACWDVRIDQEQAPESLFELIREPRHICADEEVGAYCQHIFCGWHEELTLRGEPIPDPCPRWHKHK